MTKNVFILVNFGLALRGWGGPNSNQRNSEGEAQNKVQSFSKLFNFVELGGLGDALRGSRGLGWSDYNS